MYIRKGTRTEEQANYHPLFLSAKEIPDNDLLNKDLKVLLPQISWLKYEQAIKFCFGESR